MLENVFVDNQVSRTLDPHTRSDSTGVGVSVMNPFLVTLGGQRQARPASLLLPLESLRAFLPLLVTEVLFVRDNFLRDVRYPISDKKLMLSMAGLT